MCEKQDHRLYQSLGRQYPQPSPIQEMGHLVTAGDQGGQAGPAFPKLGLPGLIHDDDQFHHLWQHQGQTDRL